MYCNMLCIMLSNITENYRLVFILMSFLREALLHTFTSVVYLHLFRKRTFRNNWLPVAFVAYCDFMLLLVMSESVQCIVHCVINCRQVLHGCDVFPIVQCLCYVWKLDSCSDWAGKTICGIFLLTTVYVSALKCLHFA